MAPIEEGQMVKVISGNLNGKTVMVTRVRPSGSLAVHYTNANGRIQDDIVQPSNVIPQLSIRIPKNSNGNNRVSPRRANRKTRRNRRGNRKTRRNRR